MANHYNAAGEPILPDDPIAFTGLVLSLPLLHLAVDGSGGLGATVGTITSEVERIGASDHATAARSYATA